MGALITKGDKNMKKGFTLIELLVVVLIIGILAAVALPQYTKAVEKSRATEGMSLLGNLVTAEQIYKMASGSFTNDLSLLDLQLPGVGSATVSTITTKNFTLTIPTATATNFEAQVRRVNADGTNTSGDMSYALVVAIDANGNVTRTCKGSETTCKSISNGAAACPSTGTGKDWCYAGDLR